MTTTEALSCPQASTALQQAEPPHCLNRPGVPWTPQLAREEPGRMRTHTRYPQEVRDPATAPPKKDKPGPSFFGARFENEYPGWAAWTRTVLLPSIVLY